MKNVNKKFDDFQALKNLSIHVNTGSIYGLVGTNGSGKTTIIKHLTGILKQDSGEILFDGEPVYENVKLKEKIGFVPDDLSYFSPYTLKDAARYYKSMYPQWDQQRYDEMIDAFDLHSKKKMNSFSKGMQKQAAFILTMSIHPKYLILDEPIDGLDPIIRKLVWKYIVEDVSDGMTVLVSSHNLREMEGICDSIGILDHGEMKIERDLDELKSDINKIQVAFAENLSDWRTEGIPGSDSGADISDTGEGEDTGRAGVMSGAGAEAGAKESGGKTKTEQSGAKTDADADRAGEAAGVKQGAKNSEKENGAAGSDCGTDAGAADTYAGLNVVHRESRGKVDLLIIRNDSETIRKALEPYHPILFDVLPLTLEEIFIYELGGENYAVKDIIL